MILNELQINPESIENIKTKKIYDNTSVSNKALSLDNPFRKIQYINQNNYDYQTSKIYKNYHIIEYVKWLLNDEQILTDTNEKNTLLPFMNRYNATISNDNNRNIIYEKNTKRLVIRDILFISDDNNMFYNINGIDNKFPDSIIIDVLIRSNCPICLYARVENNCILVAEGTNIYIPIIPSFVMNALFFKISADPDKLLDLLINSRTAPYVNITYTIIKNLLRDSIDNNDLINHNGFMIDFISKCGNLTLLYINKDIKDKKIIYFGMIQNSEHLKKIENLIY